MKLNVGGGKNHPKLPGWTIVDLRENADLVIDISKEKLPYETASVDLIFSSHTLEHIMPDRLGFVLEEFSRVIKPTGVVRLAVPNITLAIDAYRQNDIEWFLNAELTYRDRNAPIGGLLASWFYSMSSIGNGHVHCFDFEYITYLLVQAGFVCVAQSAYRESSIEELRGEAFDRYPRESLFVEAFK